MSSRPPNGEKGKVFDPPADGGEKRHLKNGVDRATKTTDSLEKLKG